jgi:pyridoxine 5'-phosphate synthase PdxJ
MSTKPTAFGINLDHVPTLRQARRSRSRSPDPGTLP